MTARAARKSQRLRLNSSSSAQARTHALDPRVGVPRTAPGLPSEHNTELLAFHTRGSSDNSVSFLERVALDLEGPLSSGISPHFTCLAVVFLFLCCADFIVCDSTRCAQVAEA